MKPLTVCVDTETSVSVCVCVRACQQGRGSDAVGQRCKILSLKQHIAAVKLRNFLRLRDQRRIVKVQRVEEALCQRNSVGE